MTISKAAGGVIILSHLSFFLLCCLSVCFAALHSHLRESLISRAVTQTVCDSFPGEYSYSLCLADLRVAKVRSHLSQEKKHTLCIQTLRVCRHKTTHAVSDTALKHGPQTCMWHHLEYSKSFQRRGADVSVNHVLPDGELE